MNAPRVSVLMAVYNGARWLPLSLPSVLDQDFPDFEFVIVDDGSTDGTAELIGRRGDSRVAYIRNTSNLGQTASLNVALRHARAPLLARIDADDVWLPGKLGKQVAFLDAHPEVAVLGTNATRIDVHGASLGPSDYPIAAHNVRARLLRGVPVCHVSVVMRREAVVAAGGYPERYRFAADYGLWSAVARAGAVITNLAERLTLYREHPETFGAAQKVGAAGDESAEIIQLNARALAGLELSTEECRDIALLFFPQAVPTPTAVVRAYRNLRRLQRAVVGGQDARSGVELWAVLLWALTKRWSFARANGAPVGQEWWSMFGRFFSHPDISAAALAAGVFCLMGSDRAVRLKARLTSLLADRGR